jgi:hypothetical protein
MSLTNVLAGFVTGGLVLLAVPSGATASRGPAEPGSPGPWLVGNQAENQLVLDKGQPKIAVRYQLPEDARQGPNQWYTFRLRFQVAFETGNDERGTARVAASTNGGAAALITFRAQEDGVRLFYDGYLTGPHAEVTPQDTATVDYENYVQTQGIRAGESSYEIALQDRGRLVKDVRIDPASGLYRTSAPPEQLMIAVPPEIQAEPGERIDIPYVVTRRGDRPDLPLTVSAEVAGGPIRLTEGTNTFDAVGEERKGHLQAVATAPGRYQVRLTAQGGYNGPSGMVLIVVSPAAGISGAAQAFAAAGLALVGVLLLWRARTGRRRLRFQKRRGPTA